MLSSPLSVKVEGQKSKVSIGEREESILNYFLFGTPLNLHIFYLLLFLNRKPKPLSISVEETDTTPFYTFEMSNIVYFPEVGPLQISRYPGLRLERNVSPVGFTRKPYPLKYIQCYSTQVHSDNR